MANVDSLISRALSYEGYLEKATNSNLDDFKKNAGSGNYTSFARDYYKDTGIDVQGQPWCDVFVEEMFIKEFGVAASKAMLGGFSAYTPTSANYFSKMNGWYTNPPKKGDIIFYKNSERICHVGIVVKVDNSKVYTIEGNTSGAAGVIANGGGVFQKSYSLAYSSIAGYGRPNYPSDEVKTAQWTKNSDGKWAYKNSDGSYIKNDWKQLDGIWYRFDDIYMVTGWWQNQNTKKWYYLRTDGKMHTGWWEDKNKWYYLNPDKKDEGAMLTDWQSIDNKWYYFNKSGDMYEGFLELDGKKYYLDPEKGTLATGWFQDKSTGLLYYAEASGKIKTESFVVNPNSEGVIK